MPLKQNQVRYKELNFYSELEARWALFFDMLHINWIYRPTSYTVENGYQVTPSFLLGNLGLRGSKGPLWCGVADEYSELDREELADVIKQTRIDGLLLCDKQLVNESGKEGKYELPFLPAGDGFAASCGWDNCMVFLKCMKKGCGAVQVQFSESSYMYCPECQTSATKNHPAILKALEFASTTRFFTPTKRS